ncbi:MAG: 4'-phosphopantetheinyl transferase superfamily protein [Hyphomicrobiaceae bacterium]
MPVPRSARQPSLELWLVDLVADVPLLLDVAHRHGLVEPATVATVPDRHGGRVDAARDAARSALRILLAGYVGLDLARAPFRVARGGKPELAPLPDGHLRPLFSLAHCDTAAIVALSTDGAVGVDIEAPRPVRLADHRRAMLLDAARSLAPTDALPEGPAEAQFLQGWVRLEALAKATGEGLGALLGRLDDAVAPIASTRMEGRSVLVRDVGQDSVPGHFAAIAGTTSSLAADAPRPLARLLPLDRVWLERRLSGAPPWL